MKRDPLLVTISIIALLFIAVPLVIVIPLAFSDASTLLFPPEDLSLRWFENFFAREDFMDGLKVSILAAVISTVLATAIGGGAAYALVRTRGPSRYLLDIFLNLSLLVPILVLAVALLFFLSRFEISGTLPGIIIGHTILVLPLVIRTIASAMDNYNPNLEDAAANLGAPPLRVVWEVVLPQARTGLSGGAALAFVISMADATVGLFLRGPGAVPLPAAMIGYMSFRIDPIIGASSVVLMIVSLLMLVIVDRVIGFEAVIGLRKG